MAIDRARARRAALGALLAAAAALPVAAATVAGGGPAVRSTPRNVIAVAAKHSSLQRSRRNPQTNRAPQPDYMPVCSQRGYTDPACIKQEVAAIENARRHEHVRRPRLVLPRNFTHLTTAEQVFVITDLERVGRGLRPFRGLTRPLSNVAHASAVTRSDPMLAMRAMRAMRIYEYGSIWASDLGPLAADYDWMYNDGYGGSGVNLDCPARSAPGCWGHRENILGNYSRLPILIAGAGTSTPAGRSVTEVLAGSNGSSPKLTYSWKNALAHGANHYRHRHRSHHRGRHHHKH
jgi:hypothetical protein